MAIVPSPRHALDERALAQQIDWLKTIASRLPYSPDAVLTSERTGRGDRGGAAAGLRHARRASARRYHQGSGRGGRRRSTICATTCCTPMRCPRWSRACSSAHARRHVRSHRRVRRRRPAVPACGAHAAPLAPRRPSRSRGASSTFFVELGLARTRRRRPVRAPDRYSPEHAGLELLARSLRHLLRRNYLTIALLNARGRRNGCKRQRLEELMQMLTQRLSLLFEFAPPDFYERSTFAVLHRHAARDGPRPRGRGRLAAPARAHAHVGEATSSGCCRRTRCSPSSASRSTTRP